LIDMYTVDVLSSYPNHHQDVLKHRLVYAIRDDLLNIRQYRMNKPHVLKL